MGVRLLLSVSGLHFSYGQIKALAGIDVQVREGEIVTIIGSNGAGKTTLMKVLAGVMPAAAGKIQYMGTDVSRLGSPYRVAHGLVLVPEGRQILGRMTVDENLLMGAFARKDSASVRREIDAIYERFSNLARRRSYQAGLLSGGEQQMLAIGRAMLAKPKLLMLDEPSLGLAPLVVKQIFGIVKELRDQGITILLVEQNARQALAVSDRAYVLETGRVAMHGKSAELAASRELQDVYLGGQAALA
ncbi:MAG TPA: ABC transporter ATP-binding protein [Symbiobacteriaceae bacterium]|nr:ABC transporter ATP-binding protein [Symbiobacteriaceae bacterium]